MCGDLGLSQDSGGVAEILAPYCRRYGCDDCVPIIRRRVRRIIKAGRPNKLLTLTLQNDGTGDPIEAAGFLMKSWDTFLKRLRRELGDEKLTFFHIKEGTKKGWPHLHVALRMRRVSIWDLKKWWFEITGNTFVNIKAVWGPVGAANYLTKYLTKDLVKFGKYRVWSCSRRWRIDLEEERERIPREVGGWPTRIEGGVRQHLKMLERAGYYVVWMSLRSWRAYGPHDWPEYAYRERSRKRISTTGYEEKLTWHF